MLTSIEICNAALGAIGENPIASFADPDRVSRAASMIFEPARQLVNMSVWWAFAMRRSAGLARLVDAPATDWAYAYELPADCLRIYEVGNTWDEYAVEGRAILTNATSVKLRYLADLTDTTVWHPRARFALRDLVAAELAGTVKRSMSMRSDLTVLAMQTLQMAAESDACEADPQRIETTGGFETARWV